MYDWIRTLAEMLKSLPPHQKMAGFLLIVATIPAFRSAARATTFIDYGYLLAIGTICAVTLWPLVFRSGKKQRGCVMSQHHLLVAKLIVCEEGCGQKAKSGRISRLLGAESGELTKALHELVNCNRT